MLESRYRYDLKICIIMN